MTEQRAAHVWAQVTVPVIAAITGNALGGGLQKIALGADIRIVAPDARLSVFEVRWGLIPEMTGTQVLPELVGRDKAKELTFTGRRVSGEEAAAIGLATRADPDPRKAALELAREISGFNPHARPRGEAAARDLRAGRRRHPAGRRADRDRRAHRQPQPGRGGASFEKRAPRFTD
ncbi:enoyl-CoA hydratase-related protein [Pseudonocardia sp. RS010]|uniref:enoyl-CoA hydratase-related protein n=1 Tax=Pseudonocardia sp. RS010 TaxID=3385979 RepID=UPI0039A236DB